MYIASVTPYNKKHTGTSKSFHWRPFLIRFNPFQKKRTLEEFYTFSSFKPLHQYHGEENQLTIATIACNQVLSALIVSVKCVSIQFIRSYIKEQGNSQLQIYMHVASLTSAHNLFSFKI